MHTYLIVIIAIYAIVGICWGFAHSNDIVSLLRRAKDSNGPPSDYLCIFASAAGVFVFMLALWLPVAILCDIYSKQQPGYLRLNEHRIK